MSFQLLQLNRVITIVNPLTLPHPEKQDDYKSYTTKYAIGYACDDVLIGVIDWDVEQRSYAGNESHQTYHDAEMGGWKDLCDVRILDGVDIRIGDDVEKSGEVLQAVARNNGGDVRTSHL